MDNGVVENGAPVSLADLLEAASVVEADLVVGPDVIGDFVGTKKLMLEQAHIIKRDYRLMMIPQGKNLQELLECVDWMYSYYPELVRYWGIPRWIANTMDSRQVIINDINQHSGIHHIHLLGMSKDLHDDIACTKMHNVMGIDSANPLVMGYNNRRINTPEWPAHMERGTYWDACVNVNAMMLYNVEWARSVISGL